MLYVLEDQNVSVAEAWLTFVYFFILIALAFAADRWRSKQEEEEKRLNGDDKEEKMEIFEFSAMEVYRELVKEK